MLAILLMAVLAGPAWADALPVFSPTGPDAAAYGAAEGYPVHAIGPQREQRYLVGAFSHAEQLGPSRTVAAAAAPAPLARAPSEITLAYNFRGAAHSLADYLERHPATGLLIVRDRTILFEHYQYARTDRDRFASQSMAKTVNAMLIGIAVGEGAIRSIDDPASAYVPGLAGSRIGATPIRALLHMASGIAFTEVYNGQDDAAKLSRLLWQQGGAGPVAAVRQFDTIEAPPDTVFHYAGLDSETLGLVLTAATKVRPADYLASRIWQRIGTESPASWQVDASGQEATFCCLSAVLRDWARFGELLAHDGAWNGVQIIPRQWVLDATTAPASGPFAPGVAGPFYGYGYQTWLFPGERRQFALLGVHGQSIFVDPPSKLVMVHTAVRKLPSRDPMAAETHALWAALVRQYGR
jgi:CubicO group peptidase (beta-lactamase class C family)